MDPLLDELSQLVSVPHSLRTDTMISNVGCRLPLTPKRIIGRQEEMRDILASLAPACDARLLVTGVAGVGKSVLAEHVIMALQSQQAFAEYDFYRVRGSSPEGYLCLSLSSHALLSFALPYSLTSD